MSKFRVMIVKKNGQPVGVRAATINGRTIVLGLRDEPNEMNWHDAVKLRIPTKEEWIEITKNLDAVNAALVRVGGEPLKNDWYWSSSESDKKWAWPLRIGYSFGCNYVSQKNNVYCVRQKLTLF